MDEKDLKIQALSEGFSARFAKQAAEYEDQIATLRVQLTLISRQLQDAASGEDNEEED